MSRLTKRTDKGVALITEVGKIIVQGIERCEDDREYKVYKVIVKAIEKLADYEDKEELNKI